MKARWKNFWSWNKGPLIAFGVYYVLFAGFSAYSFWKGWHIRVLMLALVALLLLVSVGGGEDYSGRWKIYLHEASLAPDVPTKRDRLTDALPLLTTLALILPPIVYVVADILLGNPLI